MKKLFLFALIGTGVLFAGCVKEKSEPLSDHRTITVADIDQSRKKTYIKVTNPALLANKAMTYLGTPYCSNWAKVAIAKWYAPCEFICSTLVWWCSEKEYDINPSPWAATTVTPGHLYLSDNTYVRAIIN